MWLIAKPFTVIVEAGTPPTFMCPVCFCNTFKNSHLIDMSSLNLSCGYYRDGEGIKIYKSNSDADIYTQRVVIIFS